MVGYASLWAVRAMRAPAPAAPHPYFSPPTTPFIIAHRGASHAETEHTRAAYDAALAAGANVLELDIRRSADGVPVVAHDANLDRVLDVDLDVAANTLDALRAAISSRHPTRRAEDLLLTLDQVLVAYPAARLNIELKQPSEALARNVAELIEQRDATERTLVVSFHHAALEVFRRASSGRVATGASAAEVARFLACYLLNVPSRPAYQALQIPPTVAGGWMSLANRDFLAFAHRHGLAVHYWTVDAPAAIERLLSVGADGIMTNRPARVAAALSR